MKSNNATVYNLSWLVQNFDLIILDNEFHLIANKDFDTRILLEDVEITVNNYKEVDDFIETYMPF